MSKTGLWSKDELLGNILQWTPMHEHTRVGQLTKTYTHQLCLEDLPRAMTDREGWQERSRDLVQLAYLDDNDIIFGWLFDFYGISTFVGYLMPNPFLYK